MIDELSEQYESSSNFRQKMEIKKKIEEEKKKQMNMKDCIQEHFS